MPYFTLYDTRISFYNTRMSIIILSSSNVLFQVSDLVFFIPCVNIKAICKICTTNQFKTNIQPISIKFNVNHNLLSCMNKK